MAFLKEQISLDKCEVFLYYLQTIRNSKHVILSFIFISETNVTTREHPLQILYISASS